MTMWPEGQKDRHDMKSLAVASAVVGVLLATATLHEDHRHA